MPTPSTPNQDAWALLCRLFRTNVPLLKMTLPPSELAALELLGKAVKPTLIDLDYFLCPSCQMQNGQVFAGKDGNVCHCPGCGPVDVFPEDTVAFALDEGWFLRSFRQALDINSRDGVEVLTQGVWRLGNARTAPVMLIRDAALIWREPSLLECVRIPGAGIQVIAPKNRNVHGMPFGPDVQWLPLEERFTFYGGCIDFIPTLEPQAVVMPALDPTAPVHGPFSADFKCVTLPEHGVVRCTEGQAAVFKALWSFGGQPMPAERIMDRAGLQSDKLIHVFKVKAKDKDKPEFEGPLFAYRTLVTTHKRQGLYAMPCSTNSLV
jgi:hypothetical protein